MPALSVSPAEETYEEVRKLIYHMVHLFRRKHGGDFEELVAEANLAFAKAYRKYDYTFGCPFTSYLCVAIYRHLLRKKQKEMRRKKLWSVSIDQLMGSEGYGTIAASIVDDVGDTSYLVSRLEELSDDASTVVDLIVASPKEFASVVADSGGATGCNRWRGILREYLRGMGWTNLRVSESFDEIGYALMSGG
jgi:hypothetical protein